MKLYHQLRRGNAITQLHHVTLHHDPTAATPSITTYTTTPAHFPNDSSTHPTPTAILLLPRREEIPHFRPLISPARHNQASDPHPSSAVSTKSRNSNPVRHAHCAAGRARRYCCGVRDVSDQSRLGFQHVCSALEGFGGWGVRWGRRPGCSIPTLPCVGPTR